MWGTEGVGGQRPRGGGPWSMVHLDAEGAAHVLVDDVADADGRRHLEEVSGHATVQPPQRTALSQDVGRDASHCVLLARTWCHC